MGDFSDFQRGQIVGARLAVVSINKTATFLRCIQSSSFQGYDGIHQVMGRHHFKRSSGRKAKLSERNRRTLKRIVSQKIRTTAAKVTAELGIRLGIPVSTKTVRREPHNANGHGRPATAKPLITEKLLKVEKSGPVIIKPGRLMFGNT